MTPEPPVLEEPVFTSFPKEPEILKQKVLNFINTHPGGCENIRHGIPDEPIANETWKYRQRVTG